VDHDLRLVVPFCHLDWAPTKNGYPTDALLGEHVVEYRSADEAGRTSEDDMHCCCEMCMSTKGGGVFDRLKVKLLLVYSSRSKRYCRDRVPAYGRHSGSPRVSLSRWHMSSRRVDEYGITGWAVEISIAKSSDGRPGQKGRRKRG
jgi:hypothetical protein